MKISSTISLLFPLFLFLIHTTNGHDITQILKKFPDFSNFNTYLTQTNLATTINSRQSITVLVVDNGNLFPMFRKSPDVIKNILSAHILLDYYDVTKLHQLSGSSPLLTTLFQSTGQARGQQGFLKVSHPSAESTAFGSAMPGSTQLSNLVKSVVAEPYKISVLQISNLIIPQGIDGTKISGPLATTAPANATAPANTMPPPANATAPPANTTVPPPPPAPATATPPPVAPATATPPPQSSMAPPPTTASNTPPPPSNMTKAPASAPPTKANIAPTKAEAPTKANTTSAAPGSAPAPAPAPGAASPDASDEETPPTDEMSDEPDTGTDTPKSAATILEIGLGLVCIMALSTLYLGGSRI